ncbi:hypothetical protein [Streptomyces sp. NPDC053079]
MSRAFAIPASRCLYDARLGRDAEHVYMVMGLVLGDTLESVLRHGQPLT